MNKKGKAYLAITTSLFLFVSPELFANSSQPFNGPYVGGELGTQIAYSGETSNNNVALAIPSMFQSNFPFSNHAGLERNSIIGSIFTGYGRTRNKLYLGGELALSNSYYKMSTITNKSMFQQFQTFLIIQNYDTISSQVNVSPTQFQILARPGYLITPTSLLYSRIGTSLAKVSMNTSFTSLKRLSSVSDPSSFNQFIITTQGNKTSHRATFQVGGGLEQAINDKFTVRVDYLYTDYGTIRVNSSQIKNDSGVELLANNSASARIKNNAFMLGMTYQFS